MTKDEILSYLSKKSLSPTSTRRVSKEIINNIKDISDLEKSILSILDSDVNRSVLINHLWRLIDKASLEKRDDSRERLFICALTENDKLDLQLGEMIYFWAGKISIDEDLVNFAMQREIIPPTATTPMI